MVINIGQYGYKIRNIETATLFEYNWGVRDHYEYKDAMFTNSLFNDFLQKNGLETYKEESTRDLICLEFNYGTRSYSNEMQHLNTWAFDAQKKYRDAKAKGDDYLVTKSINRRNKMTTLTENAYNNKYAYKKLTTDEIRKIAYNEGVTVPYVTKRKDGSIIKTETIHYKMLFRSTGKAKKGTCIFICDRLYDVAKNYLYMGLELPDHDADIVGVSAYISMVASGIEGRVKINPRNILILDDIDRTFITNVISIETDNDKHCYAKNIDGYTLKNTLFDGQALIDSSIFPGWANGYILLRHHFCKMAAFNTNIQLFFQDWCRENNIDYNTAAVNDVWGNKHLLKDIELITTINAVKWIKYDVTYEYWCEWVEKDDCLFGVVKHSHPSKLGEKQVMSYQMVNSLDENIMESVVEDTMKYVQKLKEDDNFFINYLKENTNFSNDYEVLVALCEKNKNFVKSSYYRDRKRTIIHTYLLRAKSGKIIQKADNLTIVGSPYAMLLYAASGNVDDVDLDNTLYFEEQTIQCYTNMFEDGEYLAGFRSPFNGKYNMGYLHNHYDTRFEKYFNFAPQIIAVNMIGTDFQDRNNGADQDSDFLYVTNQKDIVQYAKYCYLNYPTIVNNIPKDTNKYDNVPDDFAYMDSLLAKSQLDIGLSSNLAQIAQSYAATFNDEKYGNYVAILSVIAQAAIDSSKRRFDIDISDEINRIKSEMDVEKNGYPKFWKVIRKGFNGYINNTIKCPMNYLLNLKTPFPKHTKDTIDIKEFFNMPQFTENRRTCKKVEKLIEKYQLKIGKYNHDLINDDNEEYLLLRSDFDELISEIRGLFISKNYKPLFGWLLNRAFVITPGVKRNQKKLLRITEKNKSLLMKILYEVNPKVFLECFK